MPFKRLKPQPPEVNKFTLTVGASGNTTYILDRSYPAGVYTVTFQNGDNTFDIYAIGADGTNVGYTNSGTLTATNKIKEVVVLGAANNEEIIFDNVQAGDVITPTSKGDVASAGAFVTSVDPSSLPSVDDSVTVTGGNFAADVEAYFIDQSANEVPAKTVVRNSSTEIVVTRPDSFSTADSPFTIKVVNPNVTLPTGSSAHLLSNAVTAGTNPSWVTGAAQEYDPTSAVSITLSATDADGTVSYSLQSGTLPGGLSLNGSTGEISGTPTTSDGDVNVFTIRATDEGGNFVDREFTFTAAIPALEYLVIAGGGGGGGSSLSSGGSGGGGAGGYRSSVIGESSGGGVSAESVFSFDLATNYTVTVGAGGSGGSVSSEPGFDGNNSIFDSVTSIGGGGGGFSGSPYNNIVNQGKDGGSGGGGAGDSGNSFSQGGSNTAEQGFDGGSGTDGAGSDGGGGGGGAGQAGDNADSSNRGDGGNGLGSSITGTLIGRAGGGAGGGEGSASASDGGGNGSNGITHTGGGGGGVSNTSGFNGGSGVVILRYSASYTITIGAGLTGSETTVGNEKVATITAGTGNVSFS